MIETTDILNLNFFNYGLPFYGSYKGMRYELVKEKEETKFLATVWPGPYAHDATPDEKKTTQVFPFDEDGRKDAIDWLNEQYEKNINEWKQGLSIL